MEKSIRVLVANHPRLMRESVLTTFADQPDIEIVGEVADESEICESVMKKSIYCLTLMFLLCAPAFAQQQSDRPRKTNEQGRNEYGVQQPPDLTQENLGRVAASAIQIRSVLVKDEGLMVELKRWVAKEATDNGQVVEDSNLSDQAIFERLEQDIAFRSVATRLLQRYGYLMPMPNPDSDFAKEKELVLKERARRLVQFEHQFFFFCKVR